MSANQLLPRFNLARIALVAISLLVLVVLLRSAVRHLSERIASDPQMMPPAMHIQQQLTQNAEEIVADPEIGFLPLPNIDLSIDSPDFSYRRFTDSRGFPNAGPWPEHADLVFLGDSLLLGEGMAEGEGFVPLVDAALGERTVLNLAVSGAGPERQYFIFRRFGMEAKPSLVVACLYLAADIDGEAHFRAWRADSKGMEYNPFRLSFDHRENTGHWSRLAHQLRYNPTFLWLQSIVEPRLPGTSRVIHRKTMPDGGELFFDRYTFRFAARTFSGDEKIFRDIHASLAELRTLVAGIGASFAVVLIPSKEELFAVPQDRETSGAAAIMKRQLVDSGIPVLDLYPVLRAQASVHTPYFRSDIHLNRFGNRVVADAILQWDEIRKLRTGSPKPDPLAVSTPPGPGPDESLR